MRVDRFIFYDYETFGINPALDKISQFASIKTDIDLNIVENPCVLYCHIPKDYFPNPSSILVTGITPQYVQRVGLPESIFSKIVFDILNSKFSCILGYNNIQFDDEFTRNIFYRNLLDPYEWHWKNGNSRLDVLKVVRACYVLRPDGIVWPKKKDGSISFKLKELARVNNIRQKIAHDALCDVFATIGLLKLIKKIQPRLFTFFFNNRKKNLWFLINSSKKKVFVHISGIFGFKNNYFCIFYPIMQHIHNKKIIIYINLNFKDLKIEFSKLNLKKININDLKSFFLLGFNFLYLNRSEVIVPFFCFRKSDIFRLHINEKIILKNILWVKENLRFLKSLTKYFLRDSLFKKKDTFYNVDLQLYNSFISKQDKVVSKRVHKYYLAGNFNKRFFFSSDRMTSVFYRYRARNYFDTLNKNEKKHWIEHCFLSTNGKELNFYIANLKCLIKLNKNNYKNLVLLKNVFSYVIQLSTENKLKFLKLKLI